MFTNLLINKFEFGKTINIYATSKNLNYIRLFSIHDFYLNKNQV